MGEMMVVVRRSGGLLNTSAILAAGGPQELRHGRVSAALATLRWSDRNHDNDADLKGPNAEDEAKAHDTRV
jgi:hypothetical protein